MLPKQLSKQELLQLHQRNVCEMLFTIIASAEKLALGLGKKKENNYYDQMNSASYKNESQLKKDFSLNFVFCKNVITEFKKQHGDFIFPDENIKKEMINNIKKWELLVKNKPKTLESFKLLVELIEGNITTDIP